MMIQNFRGRVAKTLAAILTLTMVQFLPSANWMSAANAGVANPGLNSADATFVAGSYIIDAGAQTGTAKQTVAQGLKPYGLIYALVKANIPVQWVIEHDKAPISQTLGNAAPDFSFDCTGSGKKNYKSGAFVIAPEYAAQAASIVTTWRGKGVVVDGPCTSATDALPVYATIKSWPRVALDAQNGSVAVKYFQNAEIPELDANGLATYRFVAPSALTPCDDIYVMPHADPTYATHKNLINFVKAGGDFYASCHAVSIVENMTDGVTTSKKVMNFLSTNGLVNYDSHVQGSPAYTIYETSTGSTFINANSYKSNYVADSGGSFADDTTPVVMGSTSATLNAVAPGDPIAQFLGVTDAAQQQGSEQIFMPAADSRWRPTTQILVYDSTQDNTAASGAASLTGGKLSYGPAASVLYGPAFGNSSYGQVMYVGGHSSAKGTVDDVAAQRIFFNFLLTASVNSNGNAPTDTDRTPTVKLEALTTSAIQPGQSIDLAGNAIGGSGSFTYKWTSKCYYSDGTEAPSSGTFDNATINSPTFTAPSISRLANCNLTLTAIDSCGRYSFGFQALAVAPKANLAITLDAPATGENGIEHSDTITVTNLDSGNTASDVVVTIKLPDGYSFGTSQTLPSGVSCTENAQVVTCKLGSVSNGTPVTFHINVTPSSAATFKTEASVTSSSLDTQLSNNVATDTTVVGPGTPTPRLTLRKSPTTQQVTSGGVAAFRLEVENNSIGGVELTNIVISDTFDVNGTLICMEGSSSTPVINVTGTGTTTATYTIASLAAGGIWTAGCELTVTSPNGTTGKTNTFSATANSTSGSPVVTPVVSNITVNPALTIEKSSAGNVTPGGEIEYTVVVTNNTTTTHHNVQILDPLPTGLSPKANSATITTTQATASSTALNGVIAFDKFAGASTSTSCTGKSSGYYINSSSSFGWADNCWTRAGSSKDRVYVANKSDGDGVAKKEKDAIYFGINKDFSANFSRQVALNANHTNVSIVLECSADSKTYDKFTISLGNKSWTDQTCESSRQQQIYNATKADIGISSSTSNYTLTISASKNSKDSRYYIIFDDIYVVANMVAEDGIFNNSLRSGSGFASGSSWTTAGYTSKLAGSMVTDQSSGTGSALKWSGQASQTATASRTFTLSTSSYASAKLHFAIYHDNFSSNGSFKVFLNDTSTANQIYSDTGTATGSAWATTAPVDLTLTPNGQQKIIFQFYGSVATYVDDIFITGSPLGEAAPTSITNTSLATALAFRTGLAPGNKITLKFKVLIAPSPFPVIGATGLVNLAEVKSDEQTIPSEAVQSDPFTKPDITVTKTAPVKYVTTNPTNVVFTYVIKNTGLNALSSIALTDPNCTPSGASTTLAAGASTTATCTVSVNRDLVGESATVQVTSLDPSSNPVNNSSSWPVVLLSPLIGVTPTPTTANIFPGNRVMYQYSVSIPAAGNTDLEDISLTTDFVSPDSCSSPAYSDGDDGDLSLQVGETWNFNCSTETLTAGTYTHHVYVHGTDPLSGLTVYDTQTVTIIVVAKPILTLSKTVRDGSGPTSTAITVGASNHIYYTETLTVSSGTLSNVKLNDSGCNIASVSKTTKGGDANSDSKLQSGEIWVYTCDAGTLTATEISKATAYGTDDASGLKILSNDAIDTVTVDIPGLLLTVEPAKEYVVAGQNDQITYTVKNTGNTTFTSFAGTDPRCSTAATTLAFNTSLAPGASWSATCTYAIPTDTLIQFGGSASGGYIPDTATAQVFAINPVMNVRKTVKVYDSTGTTLKSGSETATVATAELNDKIVFKYWVSAETSTGATLVSGLNSIFKNSYTDTDCNASTYGEVLVDGYNAGDGNHNGYIDPGEEWQFTCTAKASLTAGAGLRAAPLPKVANGGMMIMSAALKVAAPLQANATTYTSPVTVTGLSSLDDPNTTTPIITLSGSSSVTLNLPIAPPAGPAPVITLITPKITWPTPNTITWPTPLGPTQLNATATYNGVTVSGTYTYQYPSGTVLRPGTYRMRVTFNPTNSAIYSPVETYVEITVLDPAGSVTWTDPTPVTGPYKLDPSVLNATCDIPGGTLVYDPALGRLFPTGTYTLTVTCQPPAGSEYKPIKKTVTLVVLAKGQSAPTPVASPATTKLDPPTNPVANIVSRVASTISWSASKNATGYLVTIDSHKVCVTTALKCKVQQLVGPKTDIKIYATKGNLRSTYIVPTVALKQPMVIEIIYFDTAKYAIRYDSLLKLKALKAKLANLGFTRIVLSGHTDSAAYDNQTLSKNRATQTQKTLEKLLGGGYSFDLSYHGATTPMKDNSSPAGMAANRRVEIAVW